MKFFSLYGSSLSRNIPDFMSNQKKLIVFVNFKIVKIDLEKITLIILLKLLNK